MGCYLDSSESSQLRSYVTKIEEGFSEFGIGEAALKDILVDVSELKVLIEAHIINNEGRYYP